MKRTQFDHSSDPRFYEDYVEKSASPRLRAHFERIRDKTLLAIRAQFPEMARFRILDLGCNAGTQTRVWAESGHDAVGLDINAPLLDVARARAKADGLDIRFDLGTATALPYESDTFDACLMLELLEHVVDWRTCIREAVRVLRPGGAIYISTTNALCPKQEEFNLPLYSWYPRALKRHCEMLAKTSKPELANFARYPAVNWFTFGSLRRHLEELNVRCMDRFDLISTDQAGIVRRSIVGALQASPLLKLAGQMLTPGTIVLGLKSKLQ